MTDDVITPLGPDIVMIDAGRGQAYLVRAGQEHRPAAVLIDSGLPGYAPHVVNALARWQLSTVDMTTLLLTHWHPDHAGSAAEIGSWPGTEVWVHEDDAAVVRGDRVGPEPELLEQEVAPHRRVEDVVAPAARVDRELRGDGPLRDLPDGIDIDVVQTPGHTAGSVAFVLPRHRALVTGDIVANQGGRMVLGPYNVDRAQARTSFARLTRARVDPSYQLGLVCFGHGAPLRGPEVARLFEATSGADPQPFRFGPA